MGRRKKEENIIENPVPMAEDAMNPPVEEEKPEEKTADSPKASTFMRVNSPTAKINCRAEADGEILFTIDNRSKVSILGEVELDGVRWTEIHGYVMSDLLK